MTSIHNYTCDSMNTIELVNLVNYGVNAASFTSKESPNSVEKVRSDGHMAYMTAVCMLVTGRIKDTDGSIYVKK